jgi:hypothetical protein
MDQALIFRISKEKQFELKKKIQTSFKKVQSTGISKEELTIGFVQTKKIVKLYFSKRLGTYIISITNGSKKIILSKQQWSIFFGFVDQIKTRK